MHRRPPFVAKVVARLSPLRFQHQLNRHSTEAMACPEASAVFGNGHADARRAASPQFGFHRGDQITSNAAMLDVWMDRKQMNECPRAVINRLDQPARLPIDVGYEEHRGLAGCHSLHGRRALDLWIAVLPVALQDVYEGVTIVFREPTNTDGHLRLSEKGVGSN